jgi:hypothetical protein
MRFRYMFPLALALNAGAAFADQRPQRDALPLSAIVSGLEASYDIHFIDEIEWDDDGYWGVEFFTRDGMQVKLRIDPLTGGVLR